MSPLLSGLILLCTALASAQHQGNCLNGANYYDKENKRICECFADNSTTVCHSAYYNETTIEEGFKNGTKHTKKTIYSNTCHIRIESYVDNMLMLITIDGVAQPLPNQNPKIWETGSVPFTPPPVNKNVQTVQTLVPGNLHLIDDRKKYGLLPDKADGENNDDKNKPGFNFRSDSKSQLNSNYEDLKQGNCYKGTEYLDEMYMKRCTCDLSNGHVDCRRADMTNTSVGYHRLPNGRMHKTVTTIWNHWQEIVEKYVNDILMSVTVGGIRQPVVDQIPQPVVVQIPQPVVDQIPQPVVDQIPQPVVVQIPQPVVDQIPQPVVDQIPQPVVDQIPQPVVDQIPQTAVVQIPQPVVDQVPQPVVFQIPQPVVFQIPQSVEERDPIHLGSGEHGRKNNSEAELGGIEVQITIGSKFKPIPNTRILINY